MIGGNEAGKENEEEQVGLASLHTWSTWKHLEAIMIVRDAV